MASALDEAEAESLVLSVAPTSHGTKPDRLRGPIQQPAWREACLEAFGARHVVRRWSHEGDEGSAGVVLMRPGGVWPTTWRLPGAQELNEPADLSYETPAAVECLARLLVRRGIAMQLHRVRADSPTIDALRRAVGRWGHVIVRPRATYPYVQLDPSWASPESKLSSRRRGDHRRALNRAQEIGPVASEVCVPNLHELDGLLDLAFEIEASSWKGAEGTALLCDERNAAFYRGYARRACEQGVLRINFLRIGDRVAAMQIAVELDGGLWLLKVGYAPEFARCSPGNLLIADTIKYAVAAGLRSYEFLGTSEAWTRVWTETEHETVSVRVYPLSWQSLAALARDAARFALHRWQRRTP